MYFVVYLLITGLLAVDPGIWTSTNVSSILTVTGWNGTSLIIHNNLFYLFGGENDGSFNNNLTILNADGSLNRTNSLPSGLQPRAHQAFIDIGTGAIIVGGMYIANDTETALGDVWFYNYTDSTFTQKTSLPNDTILYEHCACYDSSSEIVVLFGGYGSVDSSAYTDQNNIYVGSKSFSVFLR